jgi:release factor glutamine methyltransferase
MVIRMILKKVLDDGISILKSGNIEAPAAEAGVLLCHVLNKDRTFIFVHPEYILSDHEGADFFKLIDSRLKGKPSQYLTGFQEFMSLKFKVDSNVLIPRQDTEILVESVIDHVKDLEDTECKILDIGTGSGCIAVSLAYYIKNSKVTAVDISEGALNIAGENARALGVEEKTTFIKSDLFNNLKNKEGSFDIIVSNPPYIPSIDIKELQPEVRDFEPLGALDGGTDGLDYYRILTKNAADFLKINGLLAFEVGFDQALQVAELMRENGYSTRIIKDLSGIDRVVTGVNSFVPDSYDP